MVIDATALCDWQSLAISGSASDLKFAERARRDLQLCEFQHDVAWQSTDIDATRERLVVLSDCSDTGVAGLLCARVADNDITYTVAGRTILRRKIAQYTIHQGPVTTRNPARGAIEAGMEKLATEMPTGSAVYVSAVPRGSHLDDLLADRRSGLRKAFHVIPWGRSSTHFKIRWSGSAEAYLASLSSKTKRKNVRRASQRLKSDQPLRVECFRSAGEINRFLADGAAISAKTYQARDLGLGLEDQPGREALIRFAAHRNAFLGHILYVGDIPIAFRYGFIFGKTLFAVGTGYDPAHVALAPGSILFLEALNDLERSALPIDLIDFMPHENSFKRDRANLEIQVHNYFLFPRTWSGFSIYAPIALLEIVADVAGRNLRRIRRIFGSSKPARPSQSPDSNDLESYTKLCGPACIGPTGARACRLHAASMGAHLGSHSAWRNPKVCAV